MMPRTLHRIQPFSGGDYMVGKCHITKSSSRSRSVLVLVFSFFTKNWGFFYFHRVNLSNLKKKNWEFFW